jgi:hypothetical protein
MVRFLEGRRKVMLAIIKASLITEKNKKTYDKSQKKGKRF